MHALKTLNCIIYASSGSDYDYMETKIWNQYLHTRIQDTTNTMEPKVTIVTTLRSISASLESYHLVQRGNNCEVALLSQKYYQYYYQCRKSIQNVIE
jgi:hypothetical protein